VINPYANGINDKLCNTDHEISDSPRRRLPHFSWAQKNKTNQLDILTFLNLTSFFPSNGCINQSVFAKTTNNI